MSPFHSPHLFLLSLILLISQISLLPALPAMPDPDPASVQPSLVLPASAPPATIPAFPEQSDATSACPLDLPADLLHGVSHACVPSRSRSHSRSRCCPALAAWLFSAYSATALAAARAIPASGDLPVLPDDSETCVAGAEAAIRARGVPLPRVNATCGLAYCYCGVRLRRLACPGPFTAGDGRWAPRDAAARRLERDCARPGLTGCSRCLKTLNSLKATGSKGGNVTRTNRKSGDNECQLIGLTWLLSKNRTHYLPTATAVLRAFMVAGGGPTSCYLPSDDLPLAVGSDQIDGDGSSAAVASALVAVLFSFLFLILSALV